jgi:hypothetical protein
MRQHRILALLTTLAAALAIPAAGVTAPPTDRVAGPPCGDIVLSNQDFSAGPLYTTRNPTPGGPATAPTLYAQLTIDGGVASCNGVLYTIYVYETDANGDNRTFLTSQTYTGDGTTSDFGAFTYQPPSGPTYLCVYAESKRPSGHVIDTAPEGGCDSTLQPLVLDGGVGGAGGWQ